MDKNALYQRYQDLQAYVGWTGDDAARILSLKSLLEPHIALLIDDFYIEISRHENARKVIRGGQAQIERLKQTLTVWVRDLLSARYDEEYVARRWRVGWRHVEIGLDQVYTNAALSRLRTGLIHALQQNWTGPQADLISSVQSLHKLLDLDLAIIEDAYQAEYLRRQKQVERLAAIGQMAGGVAHELRQPLNVIKTSVYYLLHARHPTPEKVKEHLDRIDAQVGLADGVISAMSSYAKLPMPQLVPVQARETIAVALEANPPPQGVTVSMDCTDVPPVLTDPLQLQIVLGNLIRNAYEAMPRGGRLDVRASINSSHEHVQIAVADTGTGIAADHLDRIMEPLFTTKPRGMGLGLAIARGIIEKLSGRLAVQSELGRGTVFRIDLPAASPPAAVDGLLSHGGRR